LRFFGDSSIIPEVSRSTFGFSHTVTDHSVLLGIFEAALQMRSALLRVMMRTDKAISLDGTSRRT